MYDFINFHIILHTYILSILRPNTLSLYVKDQLSIVLPQDYVNETN